MGCEEEHNSRCSLQDAFEPSEYDTWRLNFEVQLNWVQKNVRHDGTGTLTVS
jgi:hypothetical protein